jgi:chromosome segregation ATPase
MSAYQAAATLPGAGSASPTGGTPSGSTKGRRPGRGKTVAFVVLSLALLASLGVGAYLLVTTLSWQDRSAQWESEARGLGEDVAQLTADLDGANTELESARTQLATTQERITELANEKAQLGDENVASQQYLDYQARISEAAGTVAAALGQCTTAQDELIGYLNNRDAYNPDDLAQFATQVDGLCKAATDANTELQKELNK